VNKLLFNPVILALLIAAILEKWHQQLFTRTPLGYQDEFGFHFGPEPKRKVIWPQGW